MIDKTAHQIITELRENGALFLQGWDTRTLLHHIDQQQKDMAAQAASFKDWCKTMDRVVEERDALKAANIECSRLASEEALKAADLQGQIDNWRGTLGKHHPALVFEEVDEIRCRYRALEIRNNELQKLFGSTCADLLRDPDLSQDNPTTGTMIAIVLALIAEEFTNLANLMAEQEERCKPVANTVKPK